MCGAMGSGIERERPEIANPSFASGGLRDRAARRIDTTGRAVFRTTLVSVRDRS
jgi:hypothetical protein